MITVENQKTVTTKLTAHNKSNIYAPIGIETMETAMHLLKPNTFKLWLYMAKNQNDYTFALSCADACNFCDISKNTFHTGIRELIDVGYLINTQGNHYDFYEKLPEQEIEVTVKRADSYSF